jgi:hypothetical protein
VAHQQLAVSAAADDRFGRPELAVLTIELATKYSSGGASPRSKRTPAAGAALLK